MYKYSHGQFMDDSVFNTFRLILLSMLVKTFFCSLFKSNVNIYALVTVITMDMLDYNRKGGNMKYM